ncbi:MAG: flagellar basal body L-ring protein FlgH [Armatimonadetes bacterium]|nr:flagellar basal body L-ring protein FlgH [Armatimonadota bacterium]MBS1727000.1 flagellar basal body L-ring protein FlgH [Armatimonadota bacterium]
MKLTSIFALALTSVAFGQQVDSQDNFGSLTPKRYNSPFLARTARHVGDPLTVIISESNISSYQSNMQNNKKETVTNGPNSVPLVDWLKVGLLSSLTGSSNSSTDQQFQTTGQNSQRGTMTAKVSVLIKQILPNGTLVVEGTRAVKFGRETQHLTLSGICRVDDIRTDNTLLSENLANAEIKSEGIGAIYKKQRQGFISKLLGWLF